jgi:predicted dehydrogenase
MEDIRIGIVGCGGMAYTHTIGIAQHGRARVTAIAEPKEANRERFLKFGLPGWIEHSMATDDSLRKAVETIRSAGGKYAVYTNYKRMVEREPLDAVLILTPHTLHYRQILGALDAGLHVLVEKPMACTTRDAEDIVKAARKSRKVVGVAYQRHVTPIYIYLRETVRSGKIGKVEHILFNLCQSWYQFTKGTWRRSPKYAGGGELMDSGSHIVDAMLWVTGLKPKRVFGKMIYFDARVDINSAVIVEFANGAMGQINIIGKTPIPFGEELILTGSNGALHWKWDTLEYYDANGKKSPAEIPSYPQMTPVGNFLDAIEGKAQIAAPPECGLGVVRVTEAAFKSSKLGRYVNL